MPYTLLFLFCLFFLFNRVRVHKISIELIFLICFFFLFFLSSSSVQHERFCALNPPYWWFWISRNALWKTGTNVQTPAMAIHIQRGYTLFLVVVVVFFMCVFFCLICIETCARHVRTTEINVELRLACKNDEGWTHSTPVSTLLFYQCYIIKNLFCMCNFGFSSVISLWIRSFGEFYEYVFPYDDGFSFLFFPLPIRYNEVIPVRFSIFCWVSTMGIIFPWLFLIPVFISRFPSMMNRPYLLILDNVAIFFSPIIRSSEKYRAKYGMHGINTHNGLYSGC